MQNQTLVWVVTLLLAVPICVVFPLQVHLVCVSAFLTSLCAQEVCAHCSAAAAAAAAVPLLIQPPGMQLVLLRCPVSLVGRNCNMC
jgi:hypothetical protein